MKDFQRFDVYSEDVMAGLHDHRDAGHQLEVYLSNTAPSKENHAVKTDVAEIATGNGYTGPMDTENDITRTGAVTRVTGSTVQVQASGGEVGPFRYAVYYNATSGGRLIGFWDYGEAVTLNDNDSFQIQFPSDLMVTGNSGT